MLLNLNNLSTQELINYIHSGVIASLPADIILSIVEYYEKIIEELQQEVNQGHSDYGSGWDEAVEEMMDKLRGMQ